MDSLIGEVEAMKKVWSWFSYAYS